MGIKNGETVYIVICRYRDGDSKVSREGYDTLEKAQNFVKSRSGPVVQMDSLGYLFSAPDYNYSIVPIFVRKERS